MHPKDQFDRLMHELQELRELLAEMNKYRFAEQYLDNQELTRLLKISIRTAQQWRDNGIIPFAQLGKKIYYRLSDLEKLFELEFTKRKQLKPKLPAKRSRLKKGNNGNGWEINI